MEKSYRVTRAIQEINHDKSRRLQEVRDMRVRNMRKVTVLFVGTLATVLAAGPGLVEATGTKDTTSTSAPAEKPSMFALPHHVTGDIVSSDQKAKTLAVRDSKGKEFTFKADSDAALRLASFKAGDRVRVSYKKSHGQIVATKIADARVAKTTK